MGRASDQSELREALCQASGSSAERRPRGAPLGRRGEPVCRLRLSDALSFWGSTGLGLHAGQILKTLQLEPPAT